jgi:hypothetical protein
MWPSVSMGRGPGPPKEATAAATAETMATVDTERIYVPRKSRQVIGRSRPPRNRWTLRHASPRDLQAATGATPTRERRAG